jgi:hypothetical protein
MKDNETEKTSLDTAALKVLELIRVNIISGHLFCLKLNASIEIESLRADFQSKLEDKIRYAVRKLVERLSDGIWKMCRILTQRLCMGPAIYVKPLSTIKKFVGLDCKILKLYVIPEGRGVDTR